VVTLERVLQASAEWRIYGQGMNRIRHYYLEVVPQMEPYFVLPATDDPWASLAAVGIAVRGRAWWQGLLTAPAVIVVINSVLAGVFTGLGWRSVVGPSGPVGPGISAAVGFVLSMLVLYAYEQRAFRRQMEAVPMAFPANPNQTNRSADRGSND
jgi:hypothetical protein